jgi:hypothetical protein
MHKPVDGLSRSTVSKYWKQQDLTLLVLLPPLQVGWICQTIIIFGLPYDPELYFNPNNVAKVFFWIFACLPWCPLSKAVLDLAAATNAERDPGR